MGAGVSAVPLRTTQIKARGSFPLVSSVIRLGYTQAGSPAILG
jgi:hypothetical protein